MRRWGRDDTFNIWDGIDVKGSSRAFVYDVRVIRSLLYFLAYQINITEVR